MHAPAASFPLVPRRRLLGLAFGGLESSRRGRGSDVAGSRPYRPGDDVRSIDWSASARLSSARGRDEFVVRESYVDEAPRVVIVSDRRPSLALYPPPFPWLDKTAAQRLAAELIRASALASRGYVGLLHHGGGEPSWQPPRGDAVPAEPDGTRLFDAPEDALVRAFDHLAAHRAAVPAGTFVFVLSDFLAPIPDRVWVDALERRWDVVPVVIQDPTWEQSFPDVAGVVVPFADARTRRIARIRFSSREVAARRAANERRRTDLLARLDALDLQPVLVSSADEAEILDAFLAWSAWRQILRSRRR